MFDPEILAWPGTVLLDTARPDGENTVSWCFAEPKEVVTATNPSEVDALLESVRAATEEGYFVAGCLSYEAGYEFVNLNAPAAKDGPLGWFGVYEEPTRLHPREVEDGLRSIDSDESVRDVQLDVSRCEYVEAIDSIREFIRQGDLYQVNYTAPLHFRYTGDPRALYRRLRHRQRVPYGAFLNLGSRQILSCSPELFFRRDGERVVTRPMKGTIRRGRTLEEDRALRDELASDSKNRAENLMIVDLLRNDLSVCCRSGSVRVPELYATESYETVNQMTSTVEGQLKLNTGLEDVLRALFPCGSVTGAPKRRAMRRIRELEPDPRGVYCGAIGMAGPDETAVFNVAIRTVELQGEEGRMGIGSGIVWDSDPTLEYEECQLKGRFLSGNARSWADGEEGDFQLIESMRYEEGDIPLLDRHVQRLSRSAEYFFFDFSANRFRDRLREVLSDLGSGQVVKVRVTLDRWGGIDVETRSISEGPDTSMRVTVAQERVDSGDPFFYHKTTRRDAYDRALAAAREDGFDEAILLNEKGELTEGTHNNVFIRRDTDVLTPPVRSGLLGGVYREYVLETRSDVREEVLTLDDLREADAIFCCNAVRGWRRAHVSAPAGNHSL